MLRRNIYIVLMPFWIIVSAILLMHNINNIGVSKAGKIIKATLIEKKYERNRAVRAIFTYNGEVFSTDRNDVRYMDSLKIGTVSSFFHLSSHPDIYIWTKKNIKGYYFDVALYVSFFIVSIAGLIHTIRNWNNKERWVR